MGDIKIEKVLLTADDEQQDCWQLSAEIVKCEKPFDVVVGLTRGGYRIAHYLQEFFLLAYRQQIGLASVRCRSYSGVARAGTVEVGSLTEVWAELREGSRVLVVDDIFDRGTTALAVRNALNAAAPRPLEIKFAMLHYKPENSQVDLKPDYFARQYRGDQWLVYPCAVSDLIDDLNDLAALGMPIKIIDQIRALHNASPTT